MLDGDDVAIETQPAGEPVLPSGYVTVHDPGWLEFADSLLSFTSGVPPASATLLNSEPPPASVYIHLCVRWSRRVMVAIVGLSSETGDCHETYAQIGLFPQSSFSLV